MDTSRSGFPMDHSGGGANGILNLPNSHGAFIDKYNWADYVAIVLLSVTILIGVPMNVIARQMLTTERPTVADRLHVLKIHLNIADLLMVLVYAPAHMAWLLTYYFRGGQWLCRLLRFSDVFIFTINSYVVVCIAMNRTLTVIDPLRHTLIEDGPRRAKRMLMCAWSLAAAVSAPQLYLATLVNVPNEIDGGEPAVQCTNKLIVGADNETAIRGIALVYEAYSVCVMFWLPLSIIVGCYCMVVTKVLGHDVNVTSNIEEMTIADDSFMAQTHNNASQSKSNHLLPKKSSCYLEPQSPCRVPGQKRPASRTNSEKSASQVSVVHKSSQIVSMLVNPQQMDREKRVALCVSLSVVVGYILAWLPYMSLITWKIVSPQTYLAQESSVYFLNNLIVLHSCINPFLYCMFSRQQCC